jgi:YbbR domain-containing protein
MNVWRTITRYLPSFILAFGLAVAIWITAVTASDPVEERIYPRQVPVDIIGQDSGLVITSEPPSPVSITLSAPRSIWDRISNEQIPIRAEADLSGLKAGSYSIPIQIQIGIGPAQEISHTPRTFTLVLEELTTRTLSIQLVRRGDVAIGFQADAPTMSQSQVTVSGPKSIVDRVSQAVAVLDMSGATETVNRTLALQVLDANGNSLTGLTVTPNQVGVTQIITQRGGYRNVVVKVIVVGTVASGYRLTNITVSPPAITVFSTNPQLVNNLPGYIETTALNINNIKQDFDTHQSLNLPEGVSVVGDSSVLVQVGVAAIEGSLTFTNNKVEVDGLTPEFSASISPETVDVILSGPLPELDTLRNENLRVYVDLSDVTRVGNYQRTPRVELRLPDLTVESILPESVEVTVIIAPPVTPTPIH